MNLWLWPVGIRQFSLEHFINFPKVDSGTATHTLPLSFVFSQATKEGFVDLTGIDYVEEALSLAKKIAAESQASSTINFKVNLCRPPLDLHSHKKWFSKILTEHSPLGIPAWRSTDNWLRRWLWRCRGQRNVWCDLPHAGNVRSHAKKVYRVD